MNNKNKIFLQLPAIKGIIGDWVYYKTVMPFNEVVNRIDNDHRIREYPTLDDVLQRALSKRSKHIASYLLREESRFFNSAIIGLAGGHPKWYNFDFAPSAIPEMTLNERILQTIGILEFTGGEKLFSIDGQHRIEGIKQAIKQEASRFEIDELPIIIIAHIDDREGKIRTRKLFSEINTKAVKVSGLDDLITNESNPVDINARRLYADYALFEKDKFIALHKQANIPSDAKEFTTIINLKEVNKILYRNKFKHEDFRPPTKIIDSLYDLSIKFWDSAISNIPKYNSLFGKKKKTVVSRYRSKEGGSMLFRPIGIKILAESYIMWEEKGESKKKFWTLFNAINDDLNGVYWKNILWDNAKKNIKTKTPEKFLKEFMKYLMGLDYDKQYTHLEYNKAIGIDDPRERVKLPARPKKSR